MNNTRIICYLIGVLLLFVQPMDAQTPERYPVIYSSPTLKVRQLTDHTYQHISYLQTESWGKVGCNGMIYVHKGQAMVFDTPTNDSASVELIGMIRDELEAKVKAVVVNHFHDDCLGGLQAFHDAGIKSYTQAQTPALAEKDGAVIPQKTFDEELELKLKGASVILYHPGPAHATGNIVAYIPSEKVLFGGCMVKADGAGKGYLGDANVTTWTTSIRKVKFRFPDLVTVVPGHGKAGNLGLLLYTMEMFAEHEPLGPPIEVKARRRWFNRRKKK